MSDRLAASCASSLSASPASSLTLASRVWHAAYEEKMATVFKAAPPSGVFWLYGGYVRAWSKVVEAGGEGGAKAEQKQRPPMAPSAFEALLSTLTFTNDADVNVVSGLYRRTMEEGFGGLTELRYPDVGWGDAEWAELSATLREVACPGVVTLDLSSNRELRSAEALSGIGELKALQHLNLSWCYGLTALPDAIGQLSALQHLDLRGCKGLTVLPDAIGQLSALQHLNLRECEGLTALPDLSGLPELEVEYLPGRLQPWEAGGRKAWQLV